jgi:predicted RNA-binding Zn-ribbon protein involved in translation (DUF1610 family)
MPDMPPPLPKATEPPVTKEPTLTKAPPKGKLFPCANCGAKVEFDPRSRSLKCPYCGHETAIAEAKDKDVAAAETESGKGGRDRWAIVAGEVYGVWGSRIA